MIYFKRELPEAGTAHVNTGYKTGFRCACLPSICWPSGKKRSLINGTPAVATIAHYLYYTGAYSLGAER